MEDSGTKFLVNRNLNTILDIILAEVSDFTQSSALNSNLSNVLLNTIKFDGSNITKFVEKIFQSLYKNVDNKEKEIGIKIEEIAKEIGMYTQKDIIIPLMLNHISDIELKNSPQAFNRLRIFACILVNIHNIDVKNAENILKAIEDLDIFNQPENNNSYFILCFCYQIYH
jgi:hypothetical protein